MRSRFSAANIGLVLGPLFFAVVYFGFSPKGLSSDAIAALAVALWIGTWWVTEAVPIAVSALLPMVLFPLTGALDLTTTTVAYGHKYVFLYLGGFLLAIAIEKVNLHRRIALTIIALIGTRMRLIVLGFMVATAFLSMWISNTATSVMMLPIGLAIIAQYRDHPETPENEHTQFGKMLMLSIAYSASIGGMATLIGTPPNLVLAGIVKELYGVEISFLDWMLLAFPLSVVLLVVCWLYLTRMAITLKADDFAGGVEEISRQRAALGQMNASEKKVLLVFVLTAIAWMSRSFLLVPILPAIDDTIIALASGIILFVLPGSSKGEAILHWDDSKRVPWGILLLFGGGLAIAQGFKETGLAQWFAEQLVTLQFLPLLLMTLVLVAAINFLTEITSNLATTAMILPVLAPLAAAMGVHPYTFMISATLAASCAFMLPVATPPNAVVFGSGYVNMSDMIRAGLGLNLFSILLITLWVYYLMPLLWPLQALS
ncbi:MAG: DASS family sodium-coupled anion symporter [Bacteroidetes bacterium]|nr:DASS family sodium-coupled anion symporter [Bacteroidota bacterium]